MAESRAAPAPPQPLVLASASPRRRELLSRIVADFVVVVPDIDEAPVPGETPEQYVDRLARKKADAVASRHSAAIVLAADTTVVLDGRPIGKPADPSEARSMLGRLSGRAHEVLTGVAVVAPGRRPDALVESTTVSFAELGAGEIDWYVGTGEPMGKAGAYAIQGRGAVFVASVVGDPSNVIGLPLHATAGLLRSAGLDCPAGQ